MKILSKYRGNKEKVKCQCKLDNHIWYATPNNLLHGYGCPSCNKSHGEITIEKYLISKEIKYIPQKTFNLLVGVNGGNLSYDFYLPTYNLLIEFQGEQHEKPIDYFGGIITFKKQQEHDKRKHEYAELHNIKLLEIWYYEIDNIDEILSIYLSKKSA